MDHIDALRWHLLRGVIAWLAAAITILICIDWVYDNIILAPSSEKFVTYSSLRSLGLCRGRGNCLCIPW